MSHVTSTGGVRLDGEHRLQPGGRPTASRRAIPTWSPMAWQLI